MKPSDKLSRARALLVLDQPFFAALACTMLMQEVPDLSPPTMATDGEMIYYHPAFVEQHTVDELKWTLCHEVGHCVFEHMFTRGDRHPVLWNIAGDFIINDLLSKSPGTGKQVEGALFDETIVAAGGGTTEGVYNYLLKKYPPPPPQKAGGGEGEGGAGEGDGQPNGGLPQGAPQQWDKHMDTKGSHADRTQAQAEMRIKVSQAAQTAKMCGKMTDGLRKFLDMALEPKVDWRSVLRRFFFAKAKVDYSFARPKRRWLAEDLILPSLVGESLGEIYIAVDCSGSIGDKELQEFVTEIRAIREDTSPLKTHVVYFDSSISRYDVFDRDDDFTIHNPRSGGTAFSPIFRWATQHDIDPACCVVLTDLCCDDFGPPPHYPVLWVSTHSDRAPWGEVVKMTP